LGKIFFIFHPLFTLAYAVGIVMSVESPIKQAIFDGGIVTIMAKEKKWQSFLF
jgi:hypothetical protein